MTLERLLSSMHAVVGVKVVLLIKRFSADGATIRLFTRVCSEMGLKIVALDELLLTIAALVWFVLEDKFKLIRRN